MWRFHCIFWGRLKNHFFWAEALIFLLRWVSGEIKSTTKLRYSRHLRSIFQIGSFLMLKISILCISKEKPFRKVLDLIPTSHLYQGGLITLVAHGLNDSMMKFATKKGATGQPGRVGRRRRWRRRRRWHIFFGQCIFHDFSSPRKINGTYL